MTIPLHPLGIIKNLVEAVGLDITYTYEDLLFIEHNAFLLQMSETDGAAVGVWFNEDSTPADRPVLFSRLQAEGRKLSLQLESKGTYALSGGEDGESFELRFQPLA